MFDIDFFKKNLESFYYMFDDNEAFVNARNEYTENIFIKDFFNKHFPDKTDIKDILGEIKIFYKLFQNRILNVKVIAVDYGIVGDYQINTETLFIKRELQLFYGSMAEPCEFEGYWNAYKNLDTMFTIFIESGFVKTDNTSEKILKLKLCLDEDIKSENILYKSETDELILHFDNFEVKCPNFSGAELTYKNIPDEISEDDFRMAKYIMDKINKVLLDR